MAFPHIMRVRGHIFFLSFVSRVWETRAHSLRRPWPPISLQDRSTRMSSEAIARPDVTYTRRTDPTPYWVCFPADEGAFWHFVARSHEDGQTQATSSQPSERSHQPCSWRKR